MSLGHTQRYTVADLGPGNLERPFGFRRRCKLEVFVTSYSVAKLKDT